MNKQIDKDEFAGLSELFGGQDAIDEMRNAIVRAVTLLASCLSKDRWSHHSKRPLRIDLGKHETELLKDGKKMEVSISLELERGTSYLRWWADTPCEDYAKTLEIIGKDYTLPRHLVVPVFCSIPKVIRTVLERDEEAKAVFEKLKQASAIMAELHKQN